MTEKKQENKQENKQEEPYITVDNILDENVRIRDLKAILKSNSYETIRVQASEQLGEFGKKAITVLIEVLESEKNEEVVAAVIRSLGKIGDNTVVAHFIEKIKESLAVRSAVICALGTIGDKSFLPYLSNALKDKEKKVRIEAIRAIDRICSPDVISDLIDILRNDKDSEVRAEAIGALVNITLHHNNQKLVEDIGEILVSLKNDDATVPFLKSVINKGLKELEIIGSYDNVVSDRDNIYHEKQELEKQLDALGDEIEKVLKEKDGSISKLTKKVTVLEKNKNEKYKKVKVIYSLGILILIVEIIIGGVFIIKSGLKEKEYVQKINVLESEGYKAKEDVIKYRDIKDMEVEMKKILLVFILCYICLNLSFSQEIGLTIYNQNLGLVKDKRTIKINKGIQKVEFIDVAAKIDPTSVHFKSLTDPEKCSVLEQNFEYDLISRDKLLQKYIGKEIELEKRIGKDGDKKEIIKGTLLSTAGGLTIKSDDKILVNPSGDVSLSKIPEGLILKPTLSWLLQNDVSGENKIEVDYLTNGINWDADYVVVSDKDDKNIDLNGWVTIDNKSGATYKEAKLKLIAGDIHRIAPDALAENDVMYEAKAMQATAAPQFQEKSFFEYHMYTLQRKTTVKDNETKQIEFASATGIPVKKLYIYNGSLQQFYGYQQWSRTDRNYGIQSNKKVYVMLDFKNSKDENIRIYLGDAFDIVGERVQADFKNGDGWCDESFKINLRNHKEENIEITVVEKLNRWSNWKITQKSQDYEKKDSRTIEYKLKIPKNSENTLNYTIHYWWD